MIQKSIENYSFILDLLQINGSCYFNIFSKIDLMIKNLLTCSTRGLASNFKDKKLEEIYFFMIAMKLKTKRHLDYYFHPEQFFFHIFRSNSFKITKCVRNCLPVSDTVYYCYPCSTRIVFYDHCNIIVIQNHSDLKMTGATRTKL